MPDFVVRSQYDFPPVVERKDVVLALLGVSAGLAGLVLVFLGLLVAAFQSFDADTPKTVLDRYRRAALAVLAAFATGIVCVVLASAWLIDLNDNNPLYDATLSVFGLQILALVTATAWTVWQLMW